MPPKIKVTKEEILSAAVKIVRENGAEALNARAVAAELNVSTQPIFSHYASMAELKAEVISSAAEKYAEYIREVIESGKYPDYKSSGMAYIIFAAEERELFRLLFMRDRTGENVPDDGSDIEPIVEIIQKNTGLDRETALKLHLGMWTFVHGIATMVATDYQKWDMNLASEMLTEVYTGLKAQYMGEK